MVANYTKLLAVCCELREELDQHNLIKNCVKVGEFLSKPEFNLIEVITTNSNVGLKKGNGSVIFEVYDLNIVQLENVSKFKGYYYANYDKNLTEKTIIKTPYGDAYVFLNKHVEVTKENLISDYDYVDYLTYKNTIKK